MSQKQSDGNSTEILKDNYIPIFSNRPADYREYRAGVTLYKMKMELQKRPKEAVINLLTSLAGASWKLVEHDATKLIEASDGFDQVIKLLDQNFQYDDRVECPKAMDRFFYQLTRRSEQTMLSFMTDFREAKREIEKHNIKLPDEVSAYILLKRCGLTVEQRQMTLTQIGNEKMTEAKVEQAIYYLFGQDYRGRTSHDSRNRVKGRYSQWQRPQQAYVTDETYGYDVDYGDDEAYLGDDAEDFEADFIPEDFEQQEYGDYEYEDIMYYGDYGDDTWESEFPEGGDPETEEAFATYLDARRRFAELKANRGFWPVVALSPEGQASTAAATQRPHAPKPTKGKGKGKSKAKGNRPPPPQKGDAKSRGKAAFNADVICLRCSQPGHYAADCPQRHTRPSGSNSSSPAKKTKTATHAANMVRDMTQDDSNMTPADGYYATQDGGASSMVSGHTTFMSYLQHSLQRGIPLSHFRFREADKIFHFGGDRELRSNWSVHMPVHINGNCGRIQCFLVPGSTPMLMGRPILKALNVKVDYTTDQFSTDGTNWQNIPLGSKQEHLLQLDDMQCNPPTTDHYNFDLVTTDTYEVLQNNLTDEDTTDLHHYLQQTGHPEPEFVHQAVDEQPEPPTQQPDNYDHPLPHTTNTNDVTRPLTDKLLKSIQYHISTTENRRRSAMEQILRAHDHNQLQFWEVYSGTANLAAAMRKKGYVIFTFDLTNGWDFTKGQHRRDFYRLYYSAAPDFFWLAPPCKKWSPLQHLSIRTAAQAEALQAARDHEEHTHLKFTSNIHRRQMQHHRHSIIEQPKPSAAWNTPTFQDTPGHDCQVDQCQYGATLPDDQGDEQLIRKSTTLRTSDPRLAEALGRICHDAHQHLPIEGSSPKIGLRSTAAGAYHPAMCAAWANIIHDFMQNHYNHQEQGFQLDDGDDDDPTDNTDNHEAEQPQHDQQLQAVPQHDQHIQPAQQPMPNTGILTRLQEQGKQAAERTVQRLHRNLGHPTNKELVKLLTQRRASNSILQAAHDHKCDLCAMQQPPPQVTKSSMRHSGTVFNERILADTLWIHQPRDSATTARGIPILAIIDSTTKLMAARVIPMEKSEDFLKALERGWIRHFGTPTILQVDDHRAWSSELIRSWSSDHGVHLEISPGQAHTRLGLLERRHQVLRRAIELFLAQGNLSVTTDNVIQAVTYVIPQIINAPNLQGFSATQWAFGYVPRLPGHLMDEDLMPSHLTPSDEMVHKLQLKQQAATAVSQADIDARLRRALLRQHQAQQHTYHTGQQVFYWRDAPGGAGPKIRWKGPATIAMVEPGRAGLASNIYWLAHGTTLIRASAEHLRHDLISTHQWTPPPTPLLPLPHEHNKPWTTFATAAPHSTLTSTKATNANALKSPQRMNRRTTHHQLLPSPWILHRHTTTGTSLMMDWCGLASTSCLVLLFSARLLMPPHQWWPFCHNVSQHFNDHRHTHIALHSAMSGPTPLMPAERYHTPGPATQPSLSVRTSNTNSHSTQLHSLQAPTQKHHLWQQHHQHHRQWTHRTHRQQKMEWEAKMIPSSGTVCWHQRLSLTPIWIQHLSPIDNRRSHLGQSPPHPAQSRCKSQIHQQRHFQPRR